MQAEFAAERKALHDYISADPLLGKFFEPFLFELLPATDKRSDKVYLQEVQRCDIYLAIFGKDYGFENASGISPTEIEFDYATAHHKTRLVFLTTHTTKERHPKEVKFVIKAQEVLVRKRFSTADELKAAVYAALIRYLEEKEIIRSSPFDATLNEIATLKDIDSKKLDTFVRIARSKRGFPLNESESVTTILTHLNLIYEGRITNAALLLFGKEPQRFFINSEIRCANFRSTIVEKPIPSYKVFKGTVFELVDQAVEFVLSKLDYTIGTRAQQTQIPGKYEIPKEVITEAIVNAVAHRDYTSNASVQVMLFADRLEIWNPGTLPMGWTIEKLKQLHNSVPANPLLAEPMYLAGYIERLGTGTSDMLRLSVAAGLKEPEFIQDEMFKAILYRTGTEQAAEQVPNKYRTSTEQVKNLILNFTEGEMSLKEIMDSLNLKHRPTLLYNYLKPVLELELVELKFPETPNSPKQKYRLTAKGNTMQKQLKKLK